jgi:hypothetical protein
VQWLCESQKLREFLERMIRGDLASLDRDRIGFENWLD